MPDTLKKLQYEKHTPLATDMLHLAMQAFAQGKIMSPTQALPVYLRQQVVQGA